MGTTLPAEVHHTSDSDAPMTRVPLWLRGLALLVGLVPLAGATLPSRDHASTVDEVQAGLARQPAAWGGRTVLVQGAASSQGALVTCWRATAPAAPLSVRALCPAPGTLTLRLAPTSSWVVRLGSQSLRLTGPPLILAQQGGVAPRAPTSLSALVAPLAQIPLRAPLVAAVVSPPVALYRVRLLGPGRCDLPPAPAPRPSCPNRPPPATCTPPRGHRHHAPHRRPTHPQATLFPRRTAVTHTARASHPDDAPRRLL